MCVCCLLSAGDAHWAAPSGDAARWTVESSARGEWLLDVVSHTTRDCWTLSHTPHMVFMHFENVPVTLGPSSAFARSDGVPECVYAPAAEDCGSEDILHGV